MTSSSKRGVTLKADGQKSWFKGRAMTIAMLVGCLAVAGVLLWQYGLSGLGDNWFYLILLACPLMHFFMHRGHGHGHGGHHGHASADEPPADERQR